MPLFRHLLATAIATLSFFISYSTLEAQNTGDTIKVSIFNYDSDTRDTTVKMPDESVEYEKVILKYNMRCKNARVSTGDNRNLGCGEWDYSCNTYIVDSSKIESLEDMTPRYRITGFDGEEFAYTETPTNDFYQYDLINTSAEVNNENSFAIGSGDESDDETFSTERNSSGTQLLYTKSELNSKGLSAGMIESMSFEALDGEGNAHFAKIKIKHTDSETIQRTEIEKTGFETVFNNHYTFENGTNKFIFNKPFDWDGERSILIDISFTNTTVSEAVGIAGSPNNNTAITTQSSHSLDLSSNALVEINSDNFDQIDEEITISFWAKGGSEQPINNSILWAYENEESNRDLNIHLPWSNGSVFFDCGYDNGGYDRISVPVDAEDYKGSWSHWSFVKNSNSGSMKIYLNGDLMIEETGKTNRISIQNLLLGQSHNGNNYKGEIKDLRIWNTELSQSEIEEWAHFMIDPSHPQYENLVAYFPMNEGSGSSIRDVISSNQYEGENLIWKLTRGEELNNLYAYNSVKPNVVFYSGDYERSNTEVESLDSVSRSANIVTEYRVESRAGIARHDDIIEVNSWHNRYHAVSEYIYDADSGELLDSVAVSVDGVVEMEDLEYIRRYPFYNEIMSFVTPYGIGLDLGEDGETWYFDVTDFSPILHGDRRIEMALGGQNQEEMDVELWFIVGTPPRDVIAFDQLWQSTRRTGSARINRLRNEEIYNPVELELSSEAVSFKSRSTITGHGADGEFSQNGGNITHSLIVEGNELSWDVTQECSENPIYPQGGTWVYDRQGWCPGERSLLQEYDLTPALSPGTTALFDYGISEPAKNNGDYRYHLAHQLVSYGEPNFTLDAAITDIMKPSSHALYGRINPSCDNPRIILKNTGSAILKKVEIEYWVNEGAKNVYEWTGSLASFAEEEIELPSNGVFDILKEEGNRFHAQIRSLNDGTDEYSNNNALSGSFEVADNYSEGIIIVVKTNNRPNENSYTVYDQNENQIIRSTLPAANTTFIDTIKERGCYHLELVDNGDDGLEWWANPNQGSGFIQFRKLNNLIIRTFEPDFGGRFVTNFTIDGTVDLEEENKPESISLFPNPTSDQFIIKSPNLTRYEFSMVNSLGSQVDVSYDKSPGKIRVYTDNLPSGVYMIQLKNVEKEIVRKVVVE